MSFYTCANDIPDDSGDPTICVSGVANTRFSFLQGEILARDGLGLLARLDSTD